MNKGIGIACMVALLMVGTGQAQERLEGIQATGVAEIWVGPTMGAVEFEERIEDADRSAIVASAARRLGEMETEAAREGMQARLAELRVGKADDEGDAAARMQVMLVANGSANGAENVAAAWALAMELGVDGHSARTRNDPGRWTAAIDAIIPGAVRNATERAHAAADAAGIRMGTLVGLKVNGSYRLDRDTKGAWVKAIAVARFEIVR